MGIMDSKPEGVAHVDGLLWDLVLLVYILYGPLAQCRAHLKSSTWVISVLPISYPLKNLLKNPKGGWKEFLG